MRLGFQPLPGAPTAGAFARRTIAAKSPAQPAFAGTAQPERTPFPTMVSPHNPARIAELLAAGMDQLPAFVTPMRQDYYWSVTFPQDKRLPLDKALQLNNAFGQDVRAFGHGDGVDNDDLARRAVETSQGRTVGVGTWHVNTTQGLAALASVLKSHFAGQ